MFTPGTYYVGDLCYVLTEEQWAEVCDTIALLGGNKQFEDQAWEFRIGDKFTIGIAPTMYGDGEFVAGRDDARVLLPIDSGTIGCVSIEHVKDIDDARLHGWIVEFDYPFDIEYDEGVIRIGEVWIDTTEMPNYMEDGDDVDFDNTTS